MGNVLTIPMTKHVYGMTKEEQVEQSVVFYVCLSVGSVMAAMSISFLANNVGRVRGLFLIDGCKIASSCLIGIKHIRIFMGMTLVSGFLGCLQENMVMFLMRELLPPKISDKSGFLFYIIASLFSMIAGSMGVAFGSEKNLAKNWRVVVMWPALVSLFSFLMVFLIMGCFDTPQFYVETVRDAKQLKSKILGSMKKIYEKKSAAKFLEYKIYEVQKKANFEETKRKLARKKNKYKPNSNLPEKENWRTLLKSRYLTQLVLGTALSLLKELSGINVFLYFSTQFFDEVFEEGEGAGLTFIMSIAYMAGAYLSYF